MSTMNLSRVFNPGSIAVIGASEQDGSVGKTVIHNLITGNFKGKVFPVNPGGKDVMGLPAFSKVTDIEDPVDMAVIVTPMDRVAALVESCGQKGMAGAVILSAGGRETSKAGLQMEESIWKAARNTGIRIIGPNSLGLVNTKQNLNVSLLQQFPFAGKTAFLSQSRSVLTCVLDMAMRENLGFSHFVNLGSMLDVDFADMIDFLGSQQGVDSIALYIESIPHIRNFMSAARAVSRVKPIVALKAGRCPAGERAAASHIGAMAGEDALYDTAFKRAGILRVGDFGELFDCVAFLAKQSKPRGSRLAIITNAGAHGVLAVDRLADYGLEPASLSNQTIAELDGHLNPNWSRANPVDVRGDASLEQYIRAVRTCCEAPDVDGVLLICAPVGTLDPASLARSLADYLKTLQMPVLTAWIGGAGTERARVIFNNAGIATYQTAERAVQAFANLFQYGKNVERLHEIPVRKDIRLAIDRKSAQQIIQSSLDNGTPLLAPMEAKALLSAYGIPVSRAELDRNPEPADVELVFGARKDENFGPVLSFGTGGAMTEVYRDQAMGLPPLNHALAGQIIQETRVAKALDGFGEIAPVDPELPREILIRLSRLVTDFPQIREIEINPVMVRQGTLAGMDARVVIAPSDKASPDHLIISSYPAWQEARCRTTDGKEFLVRPIRPEDGSHVIELFSSLSPRTVYMRFFSPIKRLSHQMLIKFTQVDYDREVALTAVMDEGQTMVGMARIIFLPDRESGEFAIVLADHFQGKGIGAALLQQCLVAARKCGLKKVFGLVLSENKQMIALGKKLGFAMKRDAASHEIELTIELL